MSDIPIRADTPATLHPDMLLPLAGALEVAGTPGLGAYASGRAALDEMSRSYTAIEGAQKALVAAATKPGRRTQTPGGRSRVAGDVRMDAGGVLRMYTGREHELAEAAQRAFDRAAAIVDRSVVSMKAQEKLLGQRVADALRDPRGSAPDGIAVAQEVRAHMRNLKDRERLDFLTRAVDAGDLRTVAAALAAPPYLSGLTAEHLAVARELAARRFAPTEHAQSLAVATAIERVKTAAGTFVGRYAKVVDLDKANVAANAAIARLAQGGRK